MIKLGGSGAKNKEARQDAQFTPDSRNFRKINPRRDYDFSQMLEMMKPGEVDVPYDSLVS